MLAAYAISTPRYARLSKRRAQQVGGRNRKLLAIAENYRAPRRRTRPPVTPTRNLRGGAAKRAFVKVEEGRRRGNALHYFDELKTL
jgi:hypothetical protein